MEQVTKTEAQAIADLTRKPFVELIESVPHLIAPGENGS